MHRPLRDPLYSRIWALIRGLLFYNTVYWRRASDGLNMPSLTAEERERQRPERNPEIIRPRIYPRARIDVSQAAQISTPSGSLTPDTRRQASVEEIAPEPEANSELSQQADSRDTGLVYVKRRRYRRRHSGIGSDIDRGGFIARVFRKK